MNYTRSSSCRHGEQQQSTLAAFYRNVSRASAATQFAGCSAEMAAQYGWAAAVTIPVEAILAGGLKIKKRTHLCPKVQNAVEKLSEGIRKMARVRAEIVLKQELCPWFDLETPLASPCASTFSSPELLSPANRGGSSELPSGDDVLEFLRR